MNEIETTLEALTRYFGVSLDEAGFDAEDGDTFVRLWKGEEDTIHEGWHVSAPYSQLDLLDDDLAPRDDQHAEEIAAGLAQQHLAIVRFVFDE